ncbi:hypothetical protein JMJ55_16750 [Belnapia sp. T6]|uniref:Lipoprotein n=1 Tax=Belnapia mucosa TaxID=2804532 RepID=A0ABS1V5M0_9PROT|nr:hypothetical protein [Belnapia mucosa]MBL6456989.1 hypothetical protein [Belnapia mucosa]
MIRRIAAAALLSSSLMLAGCQNPDGSTNWGNTLLLGAGVGAAAALAAGAASDKPRPYYRNRGYGGHGGYRHPGYGGGYGGGYGRPYRGW